MLREGKKRVFDMGKVSGSFQDYIPTLAGDIEQNSQKAVSTARKHQADSLILYIPPLRGGDIIIIHAVANLAMYCDDWNLDT